MAQTWYRLFGHSLVGDPDVPSEADLEQLKSRDFSNAKSGQVDLNKLEWIRGLQLHGMKKLLLGLVFVDELDNAVKDCNAIVRNLHLSKCYNCREVSVWIFDRLVFPLPGEGPPPNEDLPADVRSDYDEASKILNISPRGSAALLRLAIQKLCVELGEKGKSIDDDIASLVKKGLSPMVQQALDVVRVIGNEAVHPGTLDLKDDKETATQLFGLVNIIAEQRISNPKHVQEVYNKLPESKRKAIEARDEKKG